MLHHLYAALASPHGIVLDTDDVERLRQRLYSARRETRDPALDCLSLVPSPTDPTQLWIVRRTSDASPSLAHSPPEGYT